MIFHPLGKYILLLKAVFRKPEKWNIYRIEIFHEMTSIGVGSLGIIAIISIFLGMVTTVQTAFQLVSDLIPKSIIGSIVRDSTILELSPTISAIVLAGKVGSSIASEIGTMRVTEQIDALEIMGINSKNHLILPKLLASVLVNPLLIIISMFLAIAGGYVAGILTRAVTSYEYIYGIQYQFKPYNVTYAMIKTVVFAFIITSVSSYHGYYTEGGALEVGKSSTRAVVYSSLVILLFNVLITQLLLA